jgi:hypothetical protein
MSKVIYKPESKSTDEYTVFVDADEVGKGSRLFGVVVADQTVFTLL